MICFQSVCLKTIFIQNVIWKLNSNGRYLRKQRIINYVVEFTFFFLSGNVLCLTTTNEYFTLFLLPVSFLDAKKWVLSVWRSLSVCLRHCSFQWDVRTHFLAMFYLNRLSYSQILNFEMIMSEVILYFKFLRYPNLNELIYLITGFKTMNR